AHDRIMQPDEFLHALAKACRDARVSFTAMEDRLSFTGSGFDVHVLAVRPHDGPHRCAFQAVTESAGLQMIVLGYGDDKLSAAERAAAQWVKGVFPVLHSWLQPKHTKLGVELAHMAVDDLETGCHFGWHLHISPVLATHLGKLSPLPEQTTIF